MIGYSNEDILDYVPISGNTPIHQDAMEAILTRDQRTTSHRVFEERSIVEKSSPAVAMLAVRIESLRKSGVSGTSNFGKTKITVKKGSHLQMRNFSSKRIRGYRGFACTWLRLGSLLIALLVASTYAAPTMPADPRLTSPRKWVNPCGLSEGPFEAAPTYVEELSTDELLKQIVLQAKTVKVDAEIFQKKIAEETFKINFTKLHEDWRTYHYKWLPSIEQIPKNLGEQLDESFLEKLDLDTALLDAYEYMQTYAVGLEQVVWDQLDHPTNLSQSFADMEFKLHTVLCELQVALVEREVKQREDVSRDVMPKEFRDPEMSGTGKHLRDWLIFRDYNNGLEYIEQVFDYLRKKNKS